MSDVLKFIVAAFAVSEVFIGSLVIRKLFAGIFLEQWANAFMRCSCAASILAFCVPFQSSLPLHRIALSAILAVAVAALVWGQFRWRGISILVSALGIILILCLTFVVAVGSLFDYLSDANWLARAHARPLFIVAESLVISAFTVLGAVLIRWFDDEKIHLL